MAKQVHFVSEILVVVRFRLLSCALSTFVSFADNAQCKVFVPKCIICLCVSCKLVHIFQMEMQSSSYSRFESFAEAQEYMCVKSQFHPVYEKLPGCTCSSSANQGACEEGKTEESAKHRKSFHPRFFELCDHRVPQQMANRKQPAVFFDKLCFSNC